MLYNIILSHCCQNMKSIWGGHLCKLSDRWGKHAFLVIYLRFPKLSYIGQVSYLVRGALNLSMWKGRLFVNMIGWVLYSQSFCLWVDAKKSHQSWLQHWMCWTVFLFSFLVLFLSYKSACQSSLWELLSWNVICGYSSLVFVYAQVE